MSLASCQTALSRIYFKICLPVGYRNSQRKEAYGCLLEALLTPRRLTHVVLMGNSKRKKKFNQSKQRSTLYWRQIKWLQSYLDIWNEVHLYCKICFRTEKIIDRRSKTWNKVYQVVRAISFTLWIRKKLVHLRCKKEDVKKERYALLSFCIYF